jgi:hypothetical protein
MAARRGGERKTLIRCGGMIASDPRRFSRRNLLWLATTLALPSGCAGSVPLDIKGVSFAAMRPDQVLLLGRIRITVLDIGLTGTAFITTTAGPEERLLPEEGQVAWVVTHRPGKEIWLGEITFSGGRLAAPVRLMPAETPSPIVYFGDIQFTGTAGLEDNRASGHASKLTSTRVDDRSSAMADFIGRNPDLRGRHVYDVISNQLFDTAPVLPAASVLR